MVTVMNPSRRALRIITALVLAALVPRSARSDEISFNRDIRPILASSCFQCHGPDQAQRKADLRLDQQTDAIGDADDSRVIVRGDAAGSELVRRITSTDPDVRMPPPDSKLSLTTTQIDQIRTWIDRGAPWERHWAFIPPRRVPIPTLIHGDWPRVPLDGFVLSRIEQVELVPAPEAEPARLLRRLALDVNGLPPEQSAVEKFVADPAPDSVERIVDRLIHSPRFGERMAVPWLDAARYADTNGYQNDGPRNMWRWRDWVIDAFNANMRFDRFTVEQLAGDMLDNATLEQRIATGFNRNHRGNAEGGIIPEEYAVEYVVDRVDTTATVFLGLTMGCARCHDHKFDPFTQKEFYQFYAYFNSVPESGRAIKIGNSPPFIKAPTRLQRRNLARLDERLRGIQTEWDALQGTIDRQLSAWCASPAAARSPDWTIGRNLLLHFPFDSAQEHFTVHAAKTSAAAPSGNDSAIDVRPVCRWNDSLPAQTAGVFGKAVRLDGNQFADAGDFANFDFFDKFTLSAWIHPQGHPDGGILSRMKDDGLYAEGWDMHLENGRIHVDLVKRWLDDGIRIRTTRAIDTRTWHHVAAVYDGSRVAAGIRIYLDGQRVETTVELDGLNQTFAIDSPLRIGSMGIRRQFRGLIDEVRIYDSNLKPFEINVLATRRSIREIASRPASEHTPGQRTKLFHYFVRHYAGEAIRGVYDHLASLREARVRHLESLPTVMVMQEQPEPRAAFVLQRGRYDKPGPRVPRGLPVSIAGKITAQPRDRLEFAYWLASEQNPLTARVFVNRVWQNLFGRGIVETTEDFGTQGTPPAHQDLLDGLAVEFMRSGWNIKTLVRRIVTSSTYRQSSKITKQHARRDPENRLLARGARFRLPAEALRDQVLMISGLLEERLGGPSVKPYQPDGLWKEIATDTDYAQSRGADLYRRSLYTYWKRTVAPPTMMTFDATAREACTVQRSTTNTPLQALTLLNETSFVEAARVLAEHALAHSRSTGESPIDWIFRRATVRRPTDSERRVLQNGLDHHLNFYAANPQAAESLISTGEAAPDATLNSAQVAALTTVASLILNLDEVVTRE